MSESKDMNIDCFNAKFDSFGDLSNRNIYASSRFVTLDKTPFEKALSECHSPELFSDQKNTNIESDNEVKVFLAHRVVTKKCYDYFSNKYPWIFAKASHVRMLEYLALGTFIDDATKRLIINQTTLAAIEDELLALNNNRYSAKRFLNEYKTIMPKFEWTEHYTDTPRMVKDTGLDDQDNKMIQESIQDKRTAGVEKVLFRTGEAFTIKKMYEARKQIDTQFADKNAALNLHADQKKVIDYLESLN